MYQPIEFNINESAHNILLSFWVESYSAAQSELQSQQQSQGIVHSVWATQP
jgi:hypothetical protein